MAVHRRQQRKPFTPAPTVDGVRYRSRFEANVAAALRAAPAEFRYEADTFPYEVARVYTPDFTVITRSGKTIFIEAKGYFPPADRRKVLNVKRVHPAIDLRLVFQRPQIKLSRRHRSWTYARWAEHHKIPWARGQVPVAWLEE